jgi:outer membrane protein TolC
VVEEADPALGEAGEMEVGAYLLTLEDALALAVVYNRPYQNRKESLYLSALGLTLDRHQYTPLPSALVSGSYNRSTTDVETYSTTARLATAAPQVLRELGTLTGSPADLLSRYALIVEEGARAAELDRPGIEVVDERSVSGQTSVGLSWLMKGGGRFAVDLTSNFLRFLTGDPRVSATSALIATFDQPLLADRLEAREAITQAERDVLYALRDFTRFRKTFAVDVASRYYSVLQQRDSLANSYRGFLTFQQQLERIEALVEEGREPVSELGRLQQAELEERIRLTNAVRGYRQSLDDFKILLGLPVETPIVLDPSELDMLLEEGLQEWEIEPEDAIEVALVSRLDLYNNRDEVADADRKVQVAANNLKPGLGLSISGRVDSMEGNRFQELDFERARWGAGLDLDLPVNKKAERNAFRSSLINLERSQRQLDLAIDTVKLQVREDWRNLDQARQTYEISRIAVGINESRVEEQELRRELGQGTALDLVDAQNALTAQRNALTRALIDHTINRLALWRDMGILFIKEDGQWEEVLDDAYT